MANEHVRQPMEYQQSSWDVGADLDEKKRKSFWATIDENKVKLSTHSNGRTEVRDIWWVWVYTKCQHVFKALKV